MSHPTLPPTPPPSRPRRSKGSNTIEFALVLPVFLAMMGGIMDFGIWFYCRTTMMEAVQIGCRAGSVRSQADSPTPEEVAATEISSRMSAFSLFGINCADSTDKRCAVDVEIIGDSPDAALKCGLSIDYPGLTGLILLPESLSISSQTLLEVQS